MGYVFDVLNGVVFGGFAGGLLNFVQIGLHQALVRLDIRFYLSNNLHIVIVFWCISHKYGMQLQDRFRIKAFMVALP